MLGLGLWIRTASTRARSKGRARMVRIVFRWGLVTVTATVTIAVIVTVTVTVTVIVTVIVTSTVDDRVLEKEHLGRCTRLLCLEVWTRLLCLKPGV